MSRIHILERVRLPESLGIGARFPAWRLLALLALFASMALGSPRAMAQDDPSAAAEAAVGDILSISSAFDQVGARASEGAWQQADSAFNDAVVILDERRPGVEAALGEAAINAFAEVDRLLQTLDVALRLEDVVRVNAAVGEVRAALATAAPGAAIVAPPSTAVDIVIGWRDALVSLMAQGQGGRFRDMRNASLDLHANVVANGPTVAEAAGPLGQGAVDRVRIHTMRLFVASLDQSLADGERAAAYYDEAIGDLLVALGVETQARPTQAVDAALQFRGFQIQATEGEVITLPIVAENLPQVGLGGFTLSARWAPQVMRLVDVTSDLGAGRLRRDDISGRMSFVMPPAPTGPSADGVVAQLRFEMIGSEYGPRDYLPEAEVDALYRAVDSSMESLRISDLAGAGDTLARAYMSFLDGREQPQSLYEDLSAYGLAKPLSDQLLALVDLCTRPTIDSEAEVTADLVVQLLQELRTQLDLTFESFLVKVTGGIDAMPVLLEVEDVTDTSRRPIGVARPIPGMVLLDASAPLSVPDRLVGTPTVPPRMIEDIAEAGEVEPGSAVVTPELEPTETPARDRDVSAPSGTERSGGASLPLPLIGALIAAVMAGAFAVASARKAEEEAAEEAAALAAEEATEGRSPVRASRSDHDHGDGRQASADSGEEDDDTIAGDGA